ncbi:MAG: UDP-N-acetylmuramoylalanine--D-glutamate ligase [Zetaproteobacteria bacterium CG2_30_46_52]|nr:MAG: UDP-N-acetylmuramoylalanine--D-glutamate ligase [Zetaproteobacteria bacterium CG2_30_46_52]
MNLSPKLEQIAVIGMGSTGISIARHLQRMHIVCACFDEANVVLPDDLQTTPLHTGPLDADVLGGFDRVIVSPGIDWRHPALLAVRGCGIPVHGDLDEFLRHYQGRIIAITGTNGKTTTTQMIALLLETLPGGCEAGGNIGTPMLDLLGHKPPAHVALELSSFQLERATQMHPHWAVLLNVQPDHADMHASPQAYKEAKLSMFNKMILGDTALFPIDVEWDATVADLAGRGVNVTRFGVIEADDERAKFCKAGVLLNTPWGDKASGKTDALFWTQDSEWVKIDCDDLMLRGHHQQQNIAIAAQAAADHGVSRTVIEEAMLSFQGLEHRLEFVGHVAGRDWFNDSKATNPDAALAALESFDEVVWICGGMRKKLDLDSLILMARKKVSFALVIGKEPDAYSLMLDKADVPYMVSHTIEQAVKDAAEKTEGPVLLSPAAASQDQFKNYAERGKAFVAAIRALEPKDKKGYAGFSDD